MTPSPNISSCQIIHYTLHSRLATNEKTLNTLYLFKYVFPLQKFGLEKFFPTDSIFFSMREVRGLIREVQGFDKKSGIFLILHKRICRISADFPKQLFFLEKSALICR